MSPVAETLTESLSSLSLNTPAVAFRTPQGRRAADAARPVARERVWHARPHVIAEELFRDALLRECRRADRFDQPFLLLLVGARPGTSRDPEAWDGVIEAVGAARRDTDMLGWFEQHEVLGLMLPEIDAADPDLEDKIDARVRQEMADRLEADGFGYVVQVLRHATVNTAVKPRTARVRSGLKRVLDVIGSLALLTVLAPVFLVLAALVKLTSKGPVFFRQQRIGEQGQPFGMLKFRTMYTNADEALHQQYVKEFIRSNAAAATSGVEQVFKIVNDPRVTRIGRFLRRTSLDELPQFWNVLRGQMSLVGPRPPLPYEVDEYKPWHYRRVLEAKPGITGLWQVTGRSRTTFDEMVRLDLRYARTHSVWTDVKILLATPRAVITGKGAC